MSVKKKKQEFDYECAVIGGGPGGLVSALYLSRFKRKVILIDAGHSRAQWIPRIRNLIGHTKGLQGVQLLKRLKQQVLQYKTDWVQGEATIRKLKKGFEVKVLDSVYTARTVILATGMRDEQPPVGNIPELRRRQVLAYCPICDGYEHSDQHVGILIQNSKAIQKAKFLRRFSKQLSLFQVRPFKVESRTRAWLQQQNINLFEGKLERLDFKARPQKKLLVKLEDQDSILVDVAYVALGVEFNAASTRFLRNLKKTEDGFILTSDHQETSIPDLYAVGDCVSALAQVSVAVGQAALAATRIHNRLCAEENESEMKRRK